MVADTVDFLVRNGRRVFVDCEHFFDGYQHDRDYGVTLLRTAFDAGASVGVMCDTNGGMLPMGIHRVVTDVLERSGVTTGHPLPGRHRRARWPTPSRPSRPASPTCSARPTGTASAPATPTCSRSSRASS